MARSLDLGVVSPFENIDFQNIHVRESKSEFPGVAIAVTAELSLELIA